jgi:cytoskeletal protein RodZ
MFQQAKELRAIRESKGIALADIAERTKIRVGMLSAIEEGRIQDLPGGIYAINYVRQYARAIGVDEIELRNALIEPPRDEEVQTRGLLEQLAERVSAAAGRVVRA